MHPLMFHAALLPAGLQSLRLFGRDHAFDLLMTLLAQCVYLLMFLLRRQRRIGAYGLDLRMGFAFECPDLLHDVLLNACNFKARLLTALMSHPLLGVGSRRGI